MSMIPANILPPTDDYDPMVSEGVLVKNVLGVFYVAWYDFEECAWWCPVGVGSYLHDIVSWQELPKE